MTDGKRAPSLIAAEKVSLSQGEVSLIQHHASDRLRLMVVDDDRITLKFIRRCLGLDEHYEVIEAENGARAFDMIQEKAPDILVTDWMMPEIDGLELCSRVRDLRTENYIYIILLTAKTAHDDIITGLAAGADDYIPKPFNQDELLARVRAGSRVVRGLKALRVTNEKLKNALNQIRTLKGLLPVCMDCKRVRDDKDYWQDIEEYIRLHTDAEPSHGLCPDCMRNRTANMDLAEKQDEQGDTRSA